MDPAIGIDWTKRIAERSEKLFDLKVGLGDGGIPVEVVHSTSIRLHCVPEEVNTFSCDWLSGWTRLDDRGVANCCLAGTWS